MWLKAAGPCPLVSLGWRCEVGVVDRDELVCELGEIVGVGVRRTEDLHEHADRHHLADVFDPVELTLGEARVQQAVGNRLGIGPIGLDRLGGKERANNPAKPRVLRRVCLDHRAANLHRLGVDLFVVDEALGGGEPCGVFGDCDDIGVLGDGPEARVGRGLGVPVHGVVFAQKAERLVRHTLLVDLNTLDVDCRKIQNFLHAVPPPPEKTVPIRDNPRKNQQKSRTFSLM